MYGRLFGVATAAYVDVTKARTTQRRFPFQYNELPAIYVISKKKYYRYRVDREADRLTPKLNYDLLEKFVVDHEFEGIPLALPEGDDWGTIPNEPTIFDDLKEVFVTMLHDGSWMDLLLMKNSDGTMNTKMMAIIYSTAFLMLITSASIIKEACCPSEKDK